MLCSLKCYRLKQEISLRLTDKRNNPPQVNKPDELLSHVYASICISHIYLCITTIISMLSLYSITFHILFLAHLFAFILFYMYIVELQHLPAHYILFGSSATLFYLFYVSLLKEVWDLRYYILNLFTKN